MLSLRPFHGLRYVKFLTCGDELPCMIYHSSFVVIALILWHGLISTSKGFLWDVITHPCPNPHGSVDSTYISLNALAPARCGNNFAFMFLKHTAVTHLWIISCGNDPSMNATELADDKSTSVQVMVWCRQATCNYLSQCWLKSMLLYGIARPQRRSDAPRQCNRNPIFKWIDLLWV